MYVVIIGFRKGFVQIWGPAISRTNTDNYPAPEASVGLYGFICLYDCLCI